jgi:hypothetical protein
MREAVRSASKAAFAQATIRYKPATVRLLFIAEAPPAFRFNRLFYFEDLRDGDTLFLEMMKTLYGPAVGFTENDFSSGSSAGGIRSRKSEFLARFTREGYFLIDASEDPMPDRASSSQKLALLRASVPRLIARLKEFAIEKNTPIVLIGGVTYSACAQSLMNLGFNVINKAMIDHPARGHQLRFRQKLGYTLRSASPLLFLSHPWKAEVNSGTKKEANWPERSQLPTSPKKMMREKRDKRDKPPQGDAAKAFPRARVVGK